MSGESIDAQRSSTQLAPVELSLCIGAAGTTIPSRTPRSQKVDGFSYALRVVLFCAERPSTAWRILETVTDYRQAVFVGVARELQL